MSDIFISYSKPDLVKARMLANALQRENWSVWWDPKIPPGKTFDEVIDRALERAKCVVVLWSKKSVLSGWVKAEAAEAKSRGILMPAMIEDDVRIPLEFRNLHASRLTDWQGEAGHTEFVALKDAVAELLGYAAQTRTGEEDLKPNKTLAADWPRAGGLKLDVPDGVYLDSVTRLMWTLENNGTDIDWPQANQYAKQLRLGGYSDWRLPTIAELEKLYDPKRDNIRNPFPKNRGWWVWSSTTQEGTDSVWNFGFSGLFSFRKSSADGHRVLCVRRSAAGFTY